MQDRGPQFSGVELMIVVAILGLLAAVAVPELVRPSGARKAVALVNQLATLRTALQAYADDHQGRWPGATGGAQLGNQLCRSTDVHGEVGRGEAFPLGPYLSTQTLPDNPFAGTNSVRLVDALPSRPTGTAAWLYDPSTGELRANTPGVGPDGRRLFQL